MNLPCTEHPTVHPTAQPAADPTAAPTVQPTAHPAGDRTGDRTGDPVADPAVESWWSAQDCAAYLGVSVSTMRRLAGRRDFPPMARFSSACRWRCDQVREWAARQVSGPTLYRVGGTLPPGRGRGPRGGRRG